MKAIAALAVNGGKISDYMGKTTGEPMPPMAAILTTAETGSEATQFTVITCSEKDIKMLLNGKVLTPDIGIIDPVFTLFISKYQILYKRKIVRYVILPVSNFDAYFGNTSFSHKWLNLFPDTLLERDKQSFGVCMVNITLLLH